MVNTAYVKAFASDLPSRLVCIISVLMFHVPFGCFVRVCIQVDLPHPLILRMDALFLNTNNSDVSHLHVQSISHWAPANIGPYSQACKVSRFSLPLLLPS